ncbi:hypothetical protein EXN66_Car014104 [Channa argus]|uniref:Uncharacterized protein n=1 Tax=Channa argus TaxID=215402 RepID=A0A6G1Q7W7_CHAAH|nr:hypothetical protein EXN66_Car014104 [Channa argus]
MFLPWSSDGLSTIRAVEEQYRQKPADGGRDCSQTVWTQDSNHVTHLRLMFLKFNDSYGRLNSSQDDQLCKKNTCQQQCGTNEKHLKHVIVL